MKYIPLDEIRTLCHNLSVATEQWFERQKKELNFEDASDLKIKVINLIQIIKEVPGDFRDFLEQCKK